MDQNTRETRLARCHALWAAATNYRRHRTHQQDEAAAKTARRNKRKASALYAAAETLLIASTLAGGIAVYELLVNTPALLAVVGAIVAAFGTNAIVAPMLGDVFNPTIDSLRGLEPEGADQ